MLRACSRLQPGLHFLLLDYGLVDHGPKALTIDVSGERFYARLDEDGKITRADHVHPFMSLDELVALVFKVR